MSGKPLEGQSFLDLRACRMEFPDQSSIVRLTVWVDTDRAGLKARKPTLANCIRFSASIVSSLSGYHCLDGRKYGFLLGLDTDLVVSTTWFYGILSDLLTELLERARMDSTTIIYSFCIGCLKGLSGWVSYALRKPKWLSLI